MIEYAPVLCSRRCRLEISERRDALRQKFGQRWADWPHAKGGFTRSWQAKPSRGLFAGTVVSWDADGVSHTPHFQRLVDLRLGKGRVRPEGEFLGMSKFDQTSEQSRTDTEASP